MRSARRTTTVWPWWLPGASPTLTSLSHFLSLEPGASRESVNIATLEAALGLTGADMGNIQFYDPAAGGLRIGSQVGFGTPFLRHFEIVASDEASVCGQALLKGAPMLARDILRDPLIAGGPSLSVLLDAGVRGVYSTPLLDRWGTLQGMLSVHRREPVADPVADHELLWPLAQRAAWLLHHAS